MSRTEPDRRMGRSRPTMNRRRFLRDGLSAGASGLLSLFGLADHRAGREAGESSPTPRVSPQTSEELAG